MKLIDEQTPYTNCPQCGRGLGGIPPQRPSVQAEEPPTSPIASPPTSPIMAPRTAPVAAPHPVPVAAPRPAPVAAPRTAPIAKPRAIPVAIPCTAPVAIPRTAPVAVPRTAPVAAPRTAPIAASPTTPIAAPPTTSVAAPGYSPIAYNDAMHGQYPTDGHYPMDGGYLMGGYYPTDEHYQMDGGYPMDGYYPTNEHYQTDGHYPMYGHGANQHGTYGTHSPAVPQEPNDVEHFTAQFFDPAPPYRPSHDPSPAGEMAYYNDDGYHRHDANEHGAYYSPAAPTDTERAVAQFFDYDPPYQPSHDASHAGGMAPYNDNGYQTSQSSSWWPASSFYSGYSHQ